MDGAVADLAAVKSSLYQRLGGTAGVAAVIDDAVDRHAANPALASRFQGLDLPELKAQGVSFLVAASGGPTVLRRPVRCRSTPAWASAQRSSRPWAATWPRRWPSKARAWPKSVKS